MQRQQQEPFKCKFSARLKNVRCLSTLLKSVHFKDTASCKISELGISFLLEESRCVFAKCIITNSIFEEYTYESPVGLTEDQEGPGREAYDEEGSVVFEVNLAILLTCLNTFGTANVPTGQGFEGHTYSGHGGGGSTTAVKINYDGPGTTLNFVLEDDGMVTTCRIPTCDSEETMLFDFNEDSHAKIILKSEWLEEGLRDLDATSDRVVMRLSTAIPHLRISSLGTIENLDVNYSLGDVLESFQFPYDRPVEASYNFVHVLHALRACQVSQKATILIDDNAFMKMQFLIPAAERKWMYTEYSFSPLEL